MREYVIHIARQCLDLDGEGRGRVRGFGGETWSELERRNVWRVGKR